MKSAFIFVCIVVFVVFIALFFLSQPGTPLIDPEKVDENVVPLCLEDIPIRYDPTFLTYQGHFRAWYLSNLDKLVGLSSSVDIHYLVSYTLFEEAVNCYTTFAGDAWLNMSLSSTEFKASFAVLARHYELRGRRSL